MSNKNYNEIFKIIKSVVESESNLIANMANTTAILKEKLGFFWIGFYLVDTNSKELVLGPFQGTLACTRIPYGRGVCGKSWSTGETIIVDDVHSFEGHIACSPLSKSEIVIPVKRKGELIAVLDIDSDNFGEFTKDDAVELEKICELLT